MRRPPTHLRHAFHAAMTAVLASSASTVVSGCGDSLEEGIENDPGFVPVDCGGGAQRWLAGLSPAAETEYMELRVAGLTGGGGVVETLGVVCGGAGDRAACEAAFDALVSEGGFVFGFCQQACNMAEIAATQADAAVLVDSAAELVSFLSPIDAPAEAMLVVQAAGFDVACERGGAKPSSDGFDVQAFRYPGCDGRTRFVVHVDAAGNQRVVRESVEVEPDPHCAVGRRPAGLCPAPHPMSPHTAAGYFARAARLEAASVHAFRRLYRELELHGAPRPLLRAARRAERDEVRHARVVSRLARSFGAAPKAARIEPLPLRDVESVARENAVEGCVRETFGALVARWQAQRAASGSVRAAFARIADEELRHAALAWKIAAWAETRMSRGARKRVQRARDEAVAALHAELADEPSSELVRLAGLPAAAQALALAGHLQRSVWQ